MVYGEAAQAFLNFAQSNGEAEGSDGPGMDVILRGFVCPV